MDRSSASRGSGERPKYEELDEGHFDRLLKFTELVYDFSAGDSAGHMQYLHRQAAIALSRPIWKAPRWPHAEACDCDNCISYAEHIEHHRRADDAAV